MRWGLGVLLSVLSLHCMNAIDPADLPRIELTAENIISKEVWLRVKFVNIQAPWGFVLERDGKEIAEVRGQRSDTLIVDTTAAPSKLQRYKVIRLEGNIRTLESDPLPVQTLDTTNHVVQWAVDTLGVRGTIFDVWTFAKDNIWAVGEIFLKDSTGKEDPVLYNLAKWNGQKWEISRVYYGLTGLAPLRAIFAFGPTDVWVGGSNQPMHWDGSQWRIFGVTSSVFSASILKIWGTSSSNLFLVGRNGSIAHYNGTSWRKMESGTSVDLEDVWGLVIGNRIHVWATGTKSDLSRSVVLYFDGGNWVTLYDSFGQPRERAFGFGSVWTDNEHILYLAGISGRWSLNLVDGAFQRLERLGGWQSYIIRGTKQNDIFTVGASSEALHYSGSSWHLYPELKEQAEGHAHWLSVQVRPELVIIGGDLFTGLFGVPVVLRGNR